MSRFDSAIDIIKINFILCHVIFIFNVIASILILFII